MPILTNPIQPSLGSLTKAVRQEKKKKNRKKDIQIEKKEAKLSLLADGMILYTENSKAINATFMKIPIAFLKEIVQTILKFL